MFFSNTLSHTEWIWFSSCFEAWESMEHAYPQRAGPIPNHAELT